MKVATSSRKRILTRRRFLSSSSSRHDDSFRLKPFSIQSNEFVTKLNLDRKLSSGTHSPTRAIRA